MTRPHGAVSLTRPEIGAAPFAGASAPGAGRRWPGVLAQTRLSPVDMLITVVFGLLLVVQISRHEMWRDEIHSWGLVLASSSLSELFANLRFTGHPGLWYVILWLASFVSDSPYTVQVVHGVIAMLLIGTIGLFSPFSRLEKLLLLCSYFVVYEYTVITRNYGLGFLIALIYAQMRATRPDRLYLNAGLLGLLANTNLSAFILAGAFGFEYALAMLFREGRDFRTALKSLLPPATIVVACAALSVAIMWPSPDISWRTTGAPLGQAFDVARLLAIVAGNVESLIPIHPLSYWSAVAESTLTPVGAGLLPILAFVLFLIFRDNPRLLLIPGLTAIGSIAVGQLVYANSMRHWGINFIAFVAALWVQRNWNPQRSYAVLALLAVNAVAGVAISIQQFPLAFSEGRATAEWIRDNDLSDAALVGTPDTLVMVVAQYLGKPVYQLDCSCTDTYLFYHKRRDAFDTRQIPERLARATQELEGRRVLFLVTHRLGDTELADIRANGVSATPLAGFDQASTDENFFVYDVTAASGATAQAGGS